LRTLPSLDYQATPNASSIPSCITRVVSDIFNTP
jgi:hypothetical protein